MDFHEFQKQQRYFISKCQNTSNDVKLHQKSYLNVVEGKGDVGKDLDRLGPVKGWYEEPIVILTEAESPLHQECRAMTVRNMLTEITRATKKVIKTRLFPTLASLLPRPT